MAFLSDIEISQQSTPEDIGVIAARLGISEDDIERYGKYKAKINIKPSDKRGKLILVTAMTPTKAGEGKTTVTVGLADGLRTIGKNAAAALREPSLGPVFGMKGGAAGGGYSQAVPMEDINLHFTGDLHAIGAANNLLAAMIDNHIFHGNALGIDPEKIAWKRCLDMNDRQLRSIESGLGGRTGGVPRKDGFDITVACEVMAALCLCEDITDLHNRLERVIIGYTKDDKPITAGDLKAAGAMTALLKDAIKPNLVQTLEHTPVFIHGGPFANIAHGCNSVIATKTALSLADYVVTEAGFGADLGAEKFMDIKCRTSGIRPSACVIVATIRSLKLHAGIPFEQLTIPNEEAIPSGFANLERHISNMSSVYGLPCVVALNRFPADTEGEIAVVENLCRKAGVEVVLSEAWGKGGKGAAKLAEKVVELCERPSTVKLCYEDDMSIEEKLNAVAKRIYHADSVILSDKAKESLARIEKLGFSRFPVCIAKTQYSFSDNAKLLCAPSGFDISIRDLRVSAGAGFVVAYAGSILTMPGLPTIPAAENIGVSADGVISGLF